VKVRDAIGGEVTMVKPGQTSALYPGEDVNARASENAGVLADARGPIPAFPRRAVDEHGRLIPLPAEERRARTEAVLRTLAALRDLPDEDPPDTLERLMRGLDESRPPDRRLFEGMS
jgi:hypothetical protein